MKDEELMKWQKNVDRQFVQLLKKRVIYFLWAFVCAFSFFLFSYGLIFNFLANGEIAAASLLNSVAIIFFLILEKVEGYYSKRYKERLKKEGKKLSKFGRVYHSGEHMAMKSALYFFYVELLVCVAIVEVKPDFPVLGNMTEYFQSVQYGILLLIATDTFLQQMFKDEKQIKNEQ